MHRKWITHETKLPHWAHDSCRIIQSSVSLKKYLSEIHNVTGELKIKSTWQAGKTHLCLWIKRITHETIYHSLPSGTLSNQRLKLVWRDTNIFIDQSYTVLCSFRTLGNPQYIGNQHQHYDHHDHQNHDHHHHLGIIQASGWHSSSQPLTKTGSAVGFGTRHTDPTSGPCGKWRSYVLEG